MRHLMVFGLIWHASCALELVPVDKCGVSRFWEIIVMILSSERCVCHTLDIINEIQFQGVILDLNLQYSTEAIPLTLPDDGIRRFHCAAPLALLVPSALRGFITHRAAWLWINSANFGPLANYTPNQFRI